MYLLMLACSSPSETGQPDTAAPGEPLVPGVTTLARIEAGSGGMEVDASGDILMGDFGVQLGGGSPGERVYRITPEGAVDVYAEGLYGASGNAMAADGTLYQSSIAGGWIAAITPSGEVSEYASGLSAPVGIAIGEDGSLYVACCGDNTIAKVATDGTVSTFASAALLSCPNGIALAGDGSFYIANFGSGKVVSVDAEGSVRPFVTLEGSNLGHITWGNERLYVAVRGEHALVEVDLSGAVTPLVGTGEIGATDGDLDVATLSYPNDLALSPDGRTLYFNDVDPEFASASIIGPVLIRALVLPEE